MSSTYTNSAVEIETLPQLSHIDFKAMDKRYAKIKFVENLLFWCLILLAMVIAILVVDAEIPGWFFALTLSMMVLTTAYSYYAAMALGYCLRDKDILYKKGLFWKSQTGVSFKRIQHIDLSHGPIERKFNLATIKFFTAGGAHVDLKMSGLARIDAEKLRSHILTITGVSDV
jgi:uncharacterized protein